jgi:hypothetical protein
MTRQEKIAKISRLCTKAGCDEKLRKIHFVQFVERGWHPHPPTTFFDWFSRHPDNVGDGTSGPVTFFNAARYYAQFCEMRELGLLNETPRSLLPKQQALALPEKQQPT